MGYRNRFWNLHNRFIQKLKFSFIVLFALTLIACSEKGDPSFDKLRWLEGDWRAEIGGRVMIESWTFNNNSFSGEGTIESNNQEDFIEKLEIIKRNDSVFYVADVPENKEKTYFHLTSSDDNKFVFSNPGHDYPQTITYFHKSHNEIEVILGGILAGEVLSRTMNFNRLD